MPFCQAFWQGTEAAVSCSEFICERLFTII
jgi:hypothetical protein